MTEPASEQPSRSDTTCAAPGCPKEAHLKCSRCQAVRYCSKGCQVTHWKAGHSKACRAATAAPATPPEEDALARQDARHQRGADLELRARLKAAEAALRSLSDERRKENRAAAREREQLKEELARLATRHASEKVELGARVAAQERDEKNELRCALDLAAKDRDALRSDIAGLKARCDARDSGIT